MKYKFMCEPAVCAVLLSLFVPLEGIHAQCCGGSGTAGNDRRLPLSVQKATPRIRVQYTGSTAPAALKLGDHVIQLAPNSNRSYALPYTPTTKPPLPGERPDMQLLNPGGGGGQPYTGTGQAKVGPENEKECPLRDGVTGDGAHDGGNQVLDAQNPSSYHEVPAEPDADAADSECPILNPANESIVGNISYGVRRPQPSCVLGYGGFAVKGGELGGTPTAPVDQPLLLDVTFSLGMGINGDLAAAYLVPALVHEETGAPIDFHPLKLEHYRVRSRTSNVTVHAAEMNGSGVWIQRDISVPEGYVRQALDATLTTMSVSFYGADQVEAGDPPILAEGAEPRMKLSISALSAGNPDPGKYTTGWSIVKEVLGQTVVTRSFWTTAQVTPPGTVPANQYWLATDTFPGSGESEVQEWASTRVSGQPERVVTMKVRQLSGVTITAQSEKQTRYRLFDWGEEIVKTAEDPAGINLWTEKTFWTGVLQTDPNYGKVKLVAHRDGSWNAYYFERTGTAPDTDLIEHHFSPWLGGASTAPPPISADIAALNALKPNCRYQKTTYKADYSVKSDDYVKNTLVRQSEPGAGQSNTRDETWNYANGTTKFLTVTIKPGSGPFAHFPSHTYRLKQGQTNEADPNNVISHSSHAYRSAWKTEEAPYYYVREN